MHQNKVGGDRGGAFCCTAEIVAGFGHILDPRCGGLRRFDVSRYQIRIPFITTCESGLNPNPIQYTFFLELDLPTLQVNRCQ